MVADTFFRWAETAKTVDRAHAASDLARAYLQSTMSQEESAAALLAMTYLLDDPAASVRKSLAETLCHSEDAPRSIVMTLAEDQPDIACYALAYSPVFSDSDLVELAARGNSVTRMLIAEREHVTRPVAAALAEIGSEEEICALLENRNAFIPHQALKRIAERHGHDCDVRTLLLDREDLPCDTRQLLLEHVSKALFESFLVKNTLNRTRLSHITRDTDEAAIFAIESDLHFEELDLLVEHLRTNAKLTPSLLMRMLCSGRVDFFSRSIMLLTQYQERRVRSILATGRIHALRALYELAGLHPDISEIFVEATMLWRKTRDASHHDALSNVCIGILAKFHRNSRHNGTTEVLELVERLYISEQRRIARRYAPIKTIDVAA